MRFTLTIKTVCFILNLFLLNPGLSFCQQDNKDLALLYLADQLDRKEIGNADDFKKILAMLSRDSARLARVYQLLDSNKILTGQDYFHAAMICQHGRDIQHSDSAVAFMRKALALDSTINKWLLAAAVDRNLVKKGKAQIYGTQFFREADNVWYRCAMDTARISDAERKKFKVETLEEQRQKLISLNKLPLSTLLDTFKDIHQLVSFCRKEWKDKKKSKYNLLESEFDNLGHQLMLQKRFGEACTVFQLNCTLYPKSSDAYDSLGECLLKTGNTKKGIKAYRKSLELDPHNENARNILSAY